MTKTTTYDKREHNLSARLAARAVLKCHQLTAYAENEYERGDACEDDLGLLPTGDQDEATTINAFAGVVGTWNTDIVAEAVASFGYADDPEFCRKVAEGMPEVADESETYASVAGPWTGFIVNREDEAQ